MLWNNRSGLDASIEHQYDRGVSRCSRDAYEQRSPGVFSLRDMTLLNVSTHGVPPLEVAPLEVGPAAEGPLTPDLLADWAVEQSSLLDAVSDDLVADARSWGQRICRVQRFADLCQQATAAGVEQFPQLELAAAWRIGQSTATRWLSEAEHFRTHLPQTLQALEAGALLVHQASALLHRTLHCTSEVARAVEAALLPTAGGLCPSDLRKQVDKAVLRAESALADPAAAEQRQADAVADRRTWSRPEVDGMGVAGALLTAEQLVAWQAGMDRLERRERTADRQAGIERTADQRRADLFAALPALVLAGYAQDDTAATAGVPARPWTFEPSQVAAQVVLNIHVPVATVLELSQEPGTLERYGPVSAQHVRLVRPHSYRRILVDAASGRPVAVDSRTVRVDQDPKAARRQVRAMLRPEVLTDTDEPQHDPSASLARLVDVRDVHCSGPGCSASRTDRDHLVPYPEGPTSARNLGRLSRRCHRAKHHGWGLERHPDGSTSWTSPGGRTSHRPSPHHPPPQVDLYRRSPRRRPPPVGRPQISGNDGPGAPPVEPCPDPVVKDVEPPF